MPQLVEQIKDINQRLEREYGVWEDGRPRFRVVWANDQLEKKWVSHTDEGWPLLHPEVREVKKYLMESCLDKYILEQLSIVPEHDKELVEKLSYEPLWVFRDRHEQYLPPKFLVAKILIDHMYKNMGIKKPISKETSQEVLLKEREELAKVEQELFGNENPTTDALAYGWGVTVPGHDDQTKLGGMPSKAEGKVN